MTLTDDRQVLAADLGMAVDDPALELLDDDRVEIYGRLSTAARRRRALPEVERELILVALNASVHLFSREGVELHVRRALDAGATPRQIMATKAEAIGSHTMSTFIPMLLEELAAAGRPVAIPEDDATLTPAELAAKERIIALRGWWYEAWRPMLRLDPEFLLATQEFMAAGDDILDAKLRELIYLSFNISTTHLYVAGGRAHMRNAIEKGATLDELLEVFELVALIGHQSTLLVIPALQQALGDRRDVEARA